MITLFFINIQIFFKMIQELRGGEVGRDIKETRLSTCRCACGCVKCVGVSICLSRSLLFYYSWLAILIRHTGAQQQDQPLSLAFVPYLPCLNLYVCKRYCFLTLPSLWSFISIMTNTYLSCIFLGFSPLSILLQVSEA